MRRPKRRLRGDKTSQRSASGAEAELVALMKQGDEAQPDAGRDPYEVIGAIPKGKTYQWCGLKVLGREGAGLFSLPQLKAAGWRPVPPRRHPQMRRDQLGRIAVDNNILCERSEALSRAARAKEEAGATAMYDGHAARGGKPLGDGFSTVREMSLARPETYSTAEYDKLADEQLRSCGDARFVEIEVPFGLCLTPGEIDAARLLRLEPKEYARRKFLMRVNVMERVGSIKTGAHYEPPIFNFVRLTTDKE